MAQVTQVTPPRLSAVEAAAGGADESLVVLIARTPQERVRLLSRMGAVGPVLIVSSAEEAQRVLESVRTAAGRESTDAARESREAGAGASPRPSQPRTVGVSLHADRQAISCRGDEVSLTPLEYELIRCLMAEPGTVKPFAELSKTVWGTSYLGDVSQVHAVVKRLRRKLTTLRAPLRVEAIRGIGFRLVPARSLSSIG